MPWWIFKGLIYLHEWQLQREQQLKEKANEWGTSTTAYPAECCNSCNWTRPNPGSSSSTCTSHRWQGLKHLGHSLPSSHTTSKELNRKRGRWDTRMMASQMAALHAGPECQPWCTQDTGKMSCEIKLKPQPGTKKKSLKFMCGFLKDISHALFKLPLYSHTIQP